MSIGSLASHLPASSIEHLEKPSFSPRPSIDGETGGKAGDGTNAFHRLLDGASGNGSGSGLLGSVVNTALPMLGLAGAGGLSGGSEAEPEPEAAAPQSGLLETMKTAGESALGMLPVVGNLFSGAEALKALSQGNLGEAALDTLGAVPVVGNVFKGLEGVARMGESLLKAG